jgi:hypothetical protein
MSHNKSCPNQTKAFSIIELSLVAMVIGVLISGVAGSEKLFKNFKLNSARAQTGSSPLSSMSGLSTWLEATSEASFQEKIYNDEVQINLWKDINPSSQIKYDATQQQSSKKPKYVASCINKLPCIRFDVGTFFDFDSRYLTNSNYTLFVVLQSRMSSFSPKAIYVLINNFHNNKYYENAIVKLQSEIPQDLLAIATSRKIGSENSDFGEIIVFNRVLKEVEINSVQEYLRKKWNIT